MMLWFQFCSESVTDGLRELSPGPFEWVVDNQSFVDGSNYIVPLIRFNSTCVYFGKVVHVNFINLLEAC